MGGNPIKRGLSIFTILRTIPLSLCRSPFVAILLKLQRKLLVRLPKWGVCLPEGCSESGSCGLARLFLPDEIVAARGAALVYAGRPGTVDLAVSV